MVGSTVAMLFMRLFCSPLEHSKNILGQNPDWQGFDFQWQNGSTGVSDIQVGARQKKYIQIVTSLFEILDAGPKVPFLVLEKFTHQMAWLCQLLIYLKPFLKRAHAAVASRRRAIDSKAKSSYQKRRMEQKEWVFSYLFGADIPIWIYVLAAKRFIRYPGESVSDCAYRTDAHGSQDAAGIGGWCHPSGSCTDIPSLDGSSWFSLEFRRGMLPEFGNTRPQAIVSALELLACLVGLHVFPQPNHRRCCPQIDSMVAVWVIASQKAKSYPILKVLRSFAFFCMVHDLWPTSSHTRGVDNDTADKLSRPSEYPWFIQLMRKVGKEIYVSIDMLSSILTTTTREDVASEERQLRALIGL
jgi:hypothetical protein